MTKSRIIFSQELLRICLVINLIEFMQKWSFSHIHVLPVSRPTGNLQENIYFFVDRYRKVAADHCVGGVENSDKYRPITATCPVHAPSGLRLSVSKAAFSTGERISFTLSQAQVSTNIDNKTRLVLLQKKKKLPIVWKL